MSAPAGEFLHFTGPDGELVARRWGSGSPLVLLHSLALSGEMWAEAAEQFCAHHEVFALDVRGHGLSGWSGRDFSVDELTGDVSALLDHLGLASAHLLGLSMGGSIALTFAGLHPGRVDRLVLCDTTAWYGEDAPLAWAERAEQAARRSRAAQMPFQIDRWYSAPYRRAHAASCAAVSGIFLRTNPAAHASACRALGAFDSRPLLHSISSPTLVLTGEDDYATPPEMGRTIDELVPDSRFVLAPGKHFAILESTALRSLVLAHLAGSEIDPTAPIAPDPCCVGAK
jgi:3-oxoadipate enol-lactonase